MKEGGKGRRGNERTGEIYLRLEIQESAVECDRMLFLSLPFIADEGRDVVS